MLSFSVRLRSARELWSAGIRPNTIPVTTETAAVKASTRQSTPTSAPCSPMRGSPAVLIVSSARIPRMPSTSPIAPPITDSATLSVSSWRMIRPRPAPIAARKATSRLRAVARTSSRFATLAQAIRRTNATAALRISNVGRAFLTNTCCSRSTLKLLFSCRPCRELRSEFACRQFQPRLRLFERDPRLDSGGRLEEVPLVDGVGIELKRDKEIGFLSELRDVELRADDADDDEWIATERDRLADDGGVCSRSACVQRPWLSTATFSPPGRSSSGVNVRPMTTRAPNRRK